ncbi:aldo-keto reductase AKR2E4-like isoform X1 [Pararge aegeria]|uniref:Jg13083 protein n=1 Tax=Pararge aegeria aegeria TaxID=348720 RepID=A0A8S4RPS9_9NEOP|nr:aldo-keto reductase AKR2E4-like isoform X1 [Pararge aegeria]CAH2238445.1 jg13083 [Pararge aegeria aegeria]
MLFLRVILNVLLLWIYPAKSTNIDKTASRDARLLNDGNTMPLVTFGTLVPVEDLDKLPEAVCSAFESGYRNLDTYYNEYFVADSIKNAISCGMVTRKELFISAKKSLDICTRSGVVSDLKMTLKILQLDYVDLFLINTPINPSGKKNCNVMDIWNGMEDAKKQGLTKSIGVVNFKKEDLDKILPYCTTKPAVNQLEVNPTNTNIELVEYCQKQGIMVMAYRPFGFTVPRPGVTNPPPPCLDDPVLVKIAEKYNVTASQVIVRYPIDRGVVPMSRSTNMTNIEQNDEINSFCLTDEDVAKINEFNVNRPVYPVKSFTFGPDSKKGTKKEQAKRRYEKFYPLA